MVDSRFAVGAAIDAEHLLLFLEFEAVAALGAINGIRQHIVEPELHLRGGFFLGRSHVRFLGFCLPRRVTPFYLGGFANLLGFNRFRLFCDMFVGGLRLDQLFAFRTETEAHHALSLGQLDFGFAFGTRELLRHEGLIAA